MLQGSGWNHGIKQEYSLFAENIQQFAEFALNIRKFLSFIGMWILLWVFNIYEILHSRLWHLYWRLQLLFFDNSSVWDSPKPQESQTELKWLHDMGPWIWASEAGSLCTHGSCLFDLLTQRGEKKQKGISVATDGVQTHFILLLKPKNASVLNCSACVFIGNKCLCFVWVKVKGSYSVGINNREYFETGDGQSNRNLDQHFHVSGSENINRKGICV